MDHDNLHHLIVQIFAAWRETLYYVTNLEQRVLLMQQMQRKYEEMCDGES